MRDRAPTAHAAALLHGSNEHHTAQGSPPPCWKPPDDPLLPPTPPRSLPPEHPQQQQHRRAAHQLLPPLHRDQQQQWPRPPHPDALRGCWLLHPSSWCCCSPLDREILVNALACAGASMSDPLMSMVDSYYAGKLGTTSLAALGSNSALFSVLYYVFFTALAVLCTQAMAPANSRGDAEGCGRGFIQALVATLAISCVLALLLLCVPEFLLGLFHTDREVMELAKTYCMIRALSLPAALAMNVSQAAFRSLLDLTTPFCVVMTANAANALLNQLLMVVLPYGMAGCGWASVASQYTGALLFACLIYRQRHAFGIPQALAGCVDAAGRPSAGRGAPGSSQDFKLSMHSSARTAGSFTTDSPPRLKAGCISPAASPGRATCSSSGSGGPMLPVSVLRLATQKALPTRLTGPFGNVQSSSTLSAAHLAAAAGISGARPGLGLPSGLHSGLGSPDGSGYGLSAAASSSTVAAAAAAAFRGASGAAAAPYGASDDDASDVEDSRVLDRWDSVGSVSKQPHTHPRNSASRSAGSTTWQRLGVLLRSLDWSGFARRFAGLMLRGLLILCCYTSANVVAAMEGAATMAAHHVVQQQQQLQMSFAWSFLHVGQSMTANLFHSTAPGGGPAAARLLSQRIISWALASCVTLACGTYLMRHSLPAIFTDDAEVASTVLSAALPAALMLGMAWNSALEGCLLAAEEQRFVVRMYPPAVGSALALLAAGLWADAGLPGVWVALMSYYLVLLVGFAARYFLWRGGRVARRSSM